jgi:hypothetical protein
MVKGPVIPGLLLISLFPYIGKSVMWILLASDLDEQLIRVNKITYSTSKNSNLARDGGTSPEIPVLARFLI